MRAGYVTVGQVGVRVEYLCQHLFDFFGRKGLVHDGIGPGLTNARRDSSDSLLTITTGTELWVLSVRMLDQPVVHFRHVKVRDDQIENRFEVRPRLAYRR